MEDLYYKIAITRIPGVGAVTARNLISYCGGVAAVFRASLKALCRVPGVGESTARAIRSEEPLRLAEKELYYLERYDVRPLFYLDEDYPHRLRSFSNAPLLLYYRGLADLNAARGIAVVGTRRPSPYGQALAEELVADLLTYRPLIISGLAYGIDVVAHRRAVEVGLPTVGVLGHGLGRIYPAVHRTVAERMLEAGGGLLSEYPFLTEPEREHFPMRNRIVAGLCDALVVVETGRKGGSIITAQFANDYNRDVFAFPGRVKDRAADGGNWLIKSHRAALLESAEDIAYVLRWQEKESAPARQMALFDELTEEEELVVRLLRQHEQMHIDQLFYDSQLSNGSLATVLLELECKGLIKTLPGKRYVLVQ